MTEYQLTIDAIFEDGVFKPMKRVPFTNGQRCTLTAVPHPMMTLAEAEAKVKEWQSMFAGMTPEEWAEFDSIVKNRGACAVESELD